MCTLYRQANTRKYSTFFARRESDISLAFGWVIAMPGRICIFFYFLLFKNKRCVCVYSDCALYMQRQDITYCDGSRWCTKFFLFKLEIAIPLETCAAMDGRYARCYVWTKWRDVKSVAWSWVFGRSMRADSFLWCGAYSIVGRLGKPNIYNSVICIGTSLYMRNRLLKYTVEEWVLFV